MIYHVAIASLTIGLGALLWLVLANLRNGPRRSAACVVVGGVGLFVVMTVFIGPHSPQSPPDRDSRSRPTAGDSPGPPGPPVPQDVGGLPTATLRSISGATPCDSAPATFATHMGPGILSSAGVVPGVVANGLEVTLLQVGVPDVSGSEASGVVAPAGTASAQLSYRIDLRVVHPAPPTEAGGALRFPLAELWILPTPLPDGKSFKPQPQRAWVTKDGAWHELVRPSDLHIEPSTTCLASVEFLVPSETRELVVYLGYRQLWALPVSAAR